MIEFILALIAGILVFGFTGILLQNDQKIKLYIKLIEELKKEQEG